jgi:hypothetical protein
MVLSLANSTRTTNHTAEVYTFPIRVLSGLDTMRMVSIALATTSTYTVMMTSQWVKFTSRKELNGGEAQCIKQMGLQSSWTQFFSDQFTK